MNVNGGVRGCINVIFVIIHEINDCNNKIGKMRVFGGTNVAKILTLFASLCLWPHLMCD